MTCASCGTHLTLDCPCFDKWVSCILSHLPSPLPVFLKVQFGHKWVLSNKLTLKWFGSFFSNSNHLSRSAYTCVRVCSFCIYLFFTNAFRQPSNNQPHGKTHIYCTDFYSCEHPISITDCSIYVWNANSSETKAGIKRHKLQLSTTQIRFFARY